MTLNKTLSPISIGLSEVETTGFARKRFTAQLNTSDFLRPKCGLALPYFVQAQQIPTFEDALVLIANQLLDILRLVVFSSIPQTLGVIMHQLWIVEELVKHFLIQLIAAARPSDIVGMNGCNVTGLLSDSSKVAEIWQPSIKRMY
jgi:hypothetical protein